MSTTQQDLDAIRARRAQQAYSTPAPQPAPQPQPPAQTQSPGAAGAVGNVAGTGAGYAGGQYVSNLASAPVPPPGVTTLPDVVATEGGSSAAAPEIGMSGYIAPLAVGAIGAYTANKAYEGYKAGEGEGPVGGFKAGLKAAGPLKYVPVLGQAPAIGGFIGGAFGTGKDKDQIGRDQVRKAMIQQGGLDEGYNLSLADGTKFNIGLDGGGKITTKSGKEINPYNVDTDNPFAHQATLWAMPLASLITGGDQKLGNDFSGYITNAAMSNANTLEGVRANVLNFMATHKIDFATARQGLDAQLAAGKIDQFHHDVYMQSLSVLESGNSKQYDTRTVQQFQQEQAAKEAATPTPPATIPTTSVPLAPPPVNAPAATTGVPRVTPPPVATPAPSSTVAGQPVSAFQKLIDEAKRREQMAGAR